VLEEASEELHGIEGLTATLSTVVLSFRVIENFARVGQELQALDGHGRAQQVAAESFDAGRISRRHAYRVVDAESRVPPGQQQRDALFAEQALVAERGRPATAGC
jgi:hypothetical protein